MGDRGILFVISAPSGTGKSTLAGRVVAETGGLRFSVSYTTRPRRPTERDGKEYHFIDDAAFDAMVSAGGFLEWATVYNRRYGTGREPTERALLEGSDLLLDIDVQGARQVRERATQAVSIFLLPPDYVTLDRRLRSRASEGPEELSRRLALARSEAEEYQHYDYVVINEDLERAASSICSIVRAERCRMGRSAGLAERIVRTFPAAS